ncbi:hypothetical protein [Paenibacillus sp. SYP-B4298]|uniref:hypothetical protein n=1 Tax=Paenibacillus sp. SYP-B4298 TaxID=2996034 RepID=UPI0022DE07D0|nr:hypothetical protein [Paenibacillus sp. SYP-B4298]
MKRYLGTWFLGVFAVVSLGSYYLLEASGGLPDFKLEKLEGAASEEERMVLYGSYRGLSNLNGLGNYKRLSISSQGTNYFFRSSFIERDTVQNYDQLDLHDDLTALKHPYRSFMREKSNAEGFYKDEQRLIYAGIALRQASSKEQDYVLQLDMLDLATGERKQLEQRLAGGLEYSWMNVRDVQLLDDELHVMVDSRGSQGNSFYEYIFHLTDGALLDQRKLEYAEELQTIVRGKTPSRPSEWLLFTTTKQESGIMRKQAILYSYRTGQFIALPKTDLRSYDTFYQDHTDYSLNEQWVSFASIDHEGITVLRYDLASGKPLPGELRLTAELLGGKYIGAMVIEQQRVYAMIYDDILMPEHKMILVAVDAVTGEVLYRGKLVPSGRGQADMNRLNVSLRPY